MYTRRSLFLRASQVGAVVGAVATQGAGNLAAGQTASASGGPADEAYWATVRAQFPLDPNLVYLNAANVCPASQRVIDKHLAYLKDFYSNPSFENRAKYVELEAKARQDLATVLGAKPSELALTRNTSEATNTIVRGLNLRAGEEVILCSHNHPSNNGSWKVLAKRTGVVLREIPTPLDNISQQRLIRSIAAAINDKTRVIAITHLTNTNGLRYPAQEIAALAKGRNIWVHLDGAQSFGMLDFRLSAIGCDSYAASLHKWPMGPLEAGVLFVKEGRQDELWPAIVTAGYSELLEGATRFGELGQRDNPRLVAAGEAARFLQQLGMAHVQARSLYLAGSLKEKLSKIPNVEVTTPMDPALSGAVVKFRVKGQNTKSLGMALWEKHRISGAATEHGPLEGIRWCPHVYNTMAEIEQAADALAKIVA